METEAGEAYAGLSQEDTRLKAAKDAKNRALAILKKEQKPTQN